VYPASVSRVIDVREEPGRVVIVLRPYALWQSLAFPIAQLAALIIVFSLWEPHPQQDRMMPLLIALGVGSVLGSVAFLVAYLLVGREERVAVSGPQLLIDHQVLRRPELRRRRTYAISRIVNLRAVGPVKPPQPWGAYLAFDYDGSTVKFGRGVAGSDADRVVNALAAAVPAWTAQEPARPSAAGDLRATSRAWSRVTLLVAALSIACLVEVALAWPLDRTKTTLALAVAIITGAFIPIWVFIIFNLESRVLWRSRTWVRLVAGLSAAGVGLLLPLQIMIWVSTELLSPFRPVDDGDLQRIWGVNLVLEMAGMFWMAHRADKRGWPVREERGVSRNTSGQ
jgi:hypothetical protein